MTHPLITLFTDYIGGKMLYIGGILLILSTILELGTAPEIVSGMYVVAGILLVQLETLTQKVENK